MDTRLDLAERLVELTRDPDLWTRLQALRSLRQWFYRTGDIPFQRRIIDTYLARMAEPDVAVVRKNLCEGLYIMLDENLGGSISLQKNIAELPEKLRPGIIEARRAVERDVLLNPVLAALERGNQTQRSAVLKAFDGSFLKGRFYARQPENMIDVGNDREFGFLYEPPLDVLERTFTALLAANLPPEPRRQAIQLCSFFKVPERTSSVAIQARLLAALADSDASVPRGGPRCRWQRTVPHRRRGRRGTDQRAERHSDPVRIWRRSRGRACRDRPQRPPGREPGDQGRNSQPVAPRGCRSRLAPRSRTARFHGCRAIERHRPGLESNLPAATNQCT